MLGQKLKAMSRPRPLKKLKKLMKKSNLKEYTKESMGIPLFGNYYHPFSYNSFTDK